MPRQTQALRPPDGEVANYRNFPRRTFRAGARWYRQHVDRPSADRGVWWYSSYLPGSEGLGRFDLVHPEGTCYLANTDGGAINELVGPETARRGWVDADLLSGRVVSTVALPHEVRAADATSARAALFRMTNELASTEDYSLSQSWAAMLRAAGFGAVLAPLRFTPGRARNLALFGAAGSPAPLPPGDRSPAPARQVAERHGIVVVDPPHSTDVVMASPPG